MKQEFKYTTSYKESSHPSNRLTHSYIPLHQLPIGHKAIVKKISLTGQARRRIQDLGLILDTQIEALLKSPCGNPIAINIRGGIIAIRKEDASHILVEEILSY